MGVLLQMGHQSDGLLSEPDLSEYTGTILNPLNYTREQMATIIQPLSNRGGFTTYFDPQLYYPRTQREALRQWSYFPDDVDTADFASDAWWRGIVDAIVDDCEQIGVDFICSPVVVPRAFTDPYYSRMVEVHELLNAAVEDTPISAVQTALVSLADLSTPGRALAIASILSRASTEQVYLIFHSDQEPRRELREVDELKGAMRLISALEEADLHVLVGFSSSDVVLWKAAGASHCATGKFFNLRRFTPGRFDDPTGGGGQLAYWFEENLLAFLRETDVLRIQGRGDLGAVSRKNPFGRQILQQLAGSPGTPWVALSWRQYLYWFADIERRISRGEVDPRSLLRVAERKWLSLDDDDILMEEARNDGSWLRPWRRALVEYRTF